MIETDILQAGIIHFIICKRLGFRSSPSPSLIFLCTQAMSLTIHFLSGVSICSQLTLNTGPQLSQTFPSSTKKRKTSILIVIELTPSSLQPEVGFLLAMHSEELANLFPYH
jgi:hypothetical protein